jgi:uncharacterized protein
MRVPVQAARCARHVTIRSASDQTIIVFVRAPESGRVKTRLAAELGSDDALGIYRRLAEHTLSVARQVRDAHVVVCYTPEDARAAVAAWLGDDVALRAQRDADLGVRMAGAIEEALTGGAGAVAIVGTDCPGLDPQLIERAFAELANADVVLGPAMDGGYYLLAVKRNHPALFDGIPWSSPDTLAETLSAAADAGLRIALLEKRRDIDTAADWAAWCGEAPEWGSYSATSRSGEVPSR